MKKIEHVHKLVREILLTKWDPIGVRKIPQAQDEYDMYIPEIVKMLRTDISQADLIRALLKIETQSMGLQGDVSRAEAVSKILMEMWRQ